MRLSSKSSRRIAAVIGAAVLTLLPFGTVEAAWTTEDVTDGWSIGAPSLDVRSDDKVGIAYQRTGFEPGILYQTDASGSWDETRISTDDDWAPDLAFDGA